MKFWDYIAINNISQRKAAEELGTTQPTVSNLVNALHVPKPDLMDRIDDWTRGEVCRVRDYVRNHHSEVKHACKTPDTAPQDQTSVS